MSCIVISDRHIATLARHFIDRMYGWKRSYGNGPGEPLDLPEIPAFISNVIRSNSPREDYNRAEQALFDVLFSLNDAAYCERYPEKSRSPFVPEFPRSKSLPTNPALVSGVLREFIYQCSEETIARTDEFKALDTYSDALMVALWKASPDGKASQELGQSEVW